MLEVVIDGMVMVRVTHCTIGGGEGKTSLHSRSISARSVSIESGIGVRGVTADMAGGATLMILSTCCAIFSRVLPSVEDIAGKGRGGGGLCCCGAVS